MIDMVREIAVRAHGDQKYGAGRPYVVHLDAVDSICAEFGYADQTTREADVLEDTALTTRQLFDLGVSADVVSAVQFCTDEPGPNRRTRKELTYRRVRGVIDTQASFGTLPGWLVTAIRVKVADRMANIRATFIGDRTDLWQMYRKERATFFAALHEPGVCDEMWFEYERLLAAPPQGLDKAVRQQAQVAGMARAYGGAESATWTEKDAVEGGTT